MYSDERDRILMEIEIAETYIADLRCRMMDMMMSKQDIDYALAPLLNMVKEKETKLQCLEYQQ